jgi:hypothetical protein
VVLCRNLSRKFDCVVGCRCWDLINQETGRSVKILNQAEFEGQPKIDDNAELVFLIRASSARL